MNERQAVADLAWAMNSPSLIESNKNYAHSLPRVRESEIDGRHLSEFVNFNSQRRVGRYFERLVHYYLLFVLRYELVANQQQITSAGRTLGEIDFLYRDHSGALTHLEVAVKFYLHLPESQYLGSHFVGPNSSDTFEQKTGRLFNHQLELGRAIWTDIDRRAAMVKGRIYYPEGVINADRSPEYLAKGHVRGTWFRVSELPRFEVDLSLRFQIFRKPRWLTIDPTAESVSGKVLRRYVTEHFERSVSPIQVGIVRDKLDLDYVFIMPDHWPARTV